MKSKMLIAVLAMIIATCTVNNFTFAQFINVPGSGNQYFRTIGTVSGIGFGNAFSLTNPPQSALHINTNQLVFPAAFTPGEVFRTDCPNLTTNWRMYRNGLERLRFSSLLTSPTSGTNDVSIANVQRGAMLFSTANINRMIILDGPNPNAQTGYVGIGNNFYAPQSLLHLNDGTFDTYMQVTNAATGATATDGVRFGTAIVDIGTIFNDVPFAEVIQQEDAPLRFFTNGIERMRIMGNTNQNINVVGNATLNQNAGFVGIGCTNPMSMLHIGDNCVFFNNGNPADGYRPWMINGTFYHLVSDNMYTGFNNTTGEATIAWGNDPTGVGGPDRLIFRFTAAQNILPPTPFASGLLGLECARMVTDGNNSFTGFGGDPNNPNQNAYSLNPDPGNTVEINSNATTIGPDFSGLRFTDLNSTITTPMANPGIGVLSVDADGDVIYVEPLTGAGFGAACPPIGITPWDLSSDWRVGLADHNLYFDNGPTLGNSWINNVYIGENCGSTMRGKLVVHQNSGDAGTIGINVRNEDPPIWSPTQIFPSIGIMSRVTIGYRISNVTFV